MPDLSLGRDPSNWLVLPPEPPARFWLDPAATGHARNDDLIALQGVLDLYETGNGPAFTDEQMYYYHRERGLRDLFFLARWILSFTRLQADLHAPIAWAWQCPDGTMLARGPAGLFRWGAIPRGHLKTTLLTIAYAIWLLLNDHDERILIYSANHTLAKKIYGLIRQLLEGKGPQGEFFLHCYPELQTTRAAREKWSENMLTIPRDTPYTDATIEASGIGATITGSHFTTELVDDVVGKLENTTQMTKIIGDLDNLTPLLDSLETGKRRMVCTPWGAYDPGSQAERHDPDALVVRRCMFERLDPTAPQGRRPITAISDFREEELIYRWRPSMARTVEQAKKLAKRNPYFMSCQYFCYPRSEHAIGFRPNWFRHFLRRGDLIVEVDQDGKEGRKIPLNACNVFITIDPIGAEKAGSYGTRDANTAPSMDTDYVGIVVMAVAEDNVWYVLDVRRERYNNDAFVNVIFDLVSYYKPKATFIEATAGQRWIFQVFMQEWRRGRPVFTLGEWSGGHASKPERIKGLIPKVSQGFLLFRTGAPEAIQEGVDACIRELLGQESHDDASDALSAMMQRAYPPGRGSEEEYRSTLNAWGEDDELLRLDGASQRVWNILKKKHDTRIFGLGEDFFAGGANNAN